jgi:hypothetical protein
MSNGENGEMLAFRDLSAEDVHSLAHMENDIRDQAAGMIGKAAFAKDTKLVIARAEQLLKNQNERDYEWLADQAAAQGRLPEIPIDDDSGLWLRIQFKRTGVTNREIAKKLDVSEGHMSAYVKGRRECPLETQFALLEIFSELPTKI